MEADGQIKHTYSAALVSLVFVLWLGLVVGLFWMLQFRYEAVWVSFDGTNLPRLESQKAMRVIHFVDESCPCSKFSRPHIVDIESKWSGQGVAFETLDMAGRSESRPQLRQAIPATPAVAVWNHAGELTYFGPYTSGAICGEGDDLLDQALSTPIEGQRINQESVGCFCQRPTNQTS